jgi:hypothetical protein
MLAHGSVLRKNFFGPDELAAIARDFRSAGLSAEEVALMEFAQKVTLEPTRSPSGTQNLDGKGHGHAVCRLLSSRIIAS